MRLSLLLAVATLALQADAKFSLDYLIGRHSGFIRDVRVALRSLTRHNIVPPPVSLPRRSTLSVHPAKCLAVPPGQVPLTDGHSGGGGDNGGSSSSGPQPTGSPGTNGTGTSWNVAQLYAGADFFKGWEFYTDPDPTNGLVQYVSEQQAWDSQLISINSAGNAVMKIDTTPVVQGNRMAVRIKTDYTFNGGLVVLDAVHAPMGCATWPAFWTNGPNWPAGGEIDIFENVNDVDVNQATIHTRSGCTIRDTIASEVTGRPVNSFNCDINAPSVTGRGCGFQTDGGDTYGPGFNSITGGVYAMLWDDSGIKVWFWRRGVIPKNVLDRQPLPDLWGKPFAFWPSDNCNSHDFFHDHNAIFTNTLCGDWAGNTWHSTGLPGQDQSCADRTGVDTCEQFVRQNGSAFANAYWEVKSVVIYQQQ